MASRSPGGRRRRFSLRRAAWRGLQAAVVLALIPVLLSFAYLAPSVRPVSTLMIKDTVLLRGYDRQWVPIEEIAPALVNSVIMSEDGQFCFHRGIDLGALREVINQALEGGRARGASTIPMQTVKNLFLWHEPLVLVRKAIEAPLALFYDGITPKRRIMEVYLNIAEWGPGIYGAEAAARHHFGKSAKNLTRREAALLAATLPNPHTRNPARPSQGLQRIATVVERRANRAGAYIGCVN